jgi:hypothetical protein
MLGWKLVPRRLHSPLFVFHQPCSNLLRKAIQQDRPMERTATGNHRESMKPIQTTQEQEEAKQTVSWFASKKLPRHIKPTNHQETFDRKLEGKQLDLFTGQTLDGPIEAARSEAWTNSYPEIDGLDPHRRRAKGHRRDRLRHQANRQNT